MTSSRPDGNPLSDVKSFNMMFRTTVGAVQSDDAVAYLRPETAQGIFTNYRNVVDSVYPDMPFGIAQRGQSGFAMKLARATLSFAHANLSKWRLSTLFTQITGRKNSRNGSN